MPKTISALSVVLGERPYAASATLIASLMVLIVISQSARSSIKPKNPLHRIPSPRETLIPLLSSAQVAALPYPPDLLPCSRDVATPYGTMRVNEWGPEEGKKVVLIHGDTTPAPVLGPIAEALVRRGCRVILFGAFASNCDIISEKLQF